MRALHASNDVSIGGEDSRRKGDKKVVPEPEHAPSDDVVMADVNPEQSDTEVAKSVIEFKVVPQDEVISLLGHGKEVFHCSWNPQKNTLASA